MKTLSFTAERTLGKLAKWLRLLGYDTVNEDQSNTNILGDEVGGERIFLTRTHRVFNQRGAETTLLIRANDPPDQIREVIQKLRIQRHHISPFSRCVRCNRLTEHVEKNRIRGNVPDFIWGQHNHFRICTGCHRIFWKGSHYMRMMDCIDHMFNDGTETI